MRQIRLRVRVDGIVQGVGFRPFVHTVATERGISGFVGNDAAGVFLEIEGGSEALASFLADLRDRAPVLAQVDRIDTERLAPTGEAGFRIVASTRGAGRDALISPDTATCDQCLAELRDPRDRRHGYPFVNCTNCGPRFTIVTDVPYDRAATTMAPFRMCPACAAEYTDPADRRFHAEPVCCAACGPTVTYTGRDGRPEPGDPIGTAARRLRDGAVIAVKGLGGYHLAALAGCEPAVAALRARKQREEKPFAVLVADLAEARRLVEVPAAAVPVLTGAARPIVLLPRLPSAPIAGSVAPGNRDLGIMLPYSPLHHLLAAHVGEPLVLTSGNVCDEPIAFTDGDAARLSGIADGFLRHNRRIQVRTDDSVVRVFRGRQMPLRRSRGYVPAPLRVSWEFDPPVLACGAELKNTFCLGKGRHAFVSHHVGDLGNMATFQAYQDGIAHFCRLFDVRPQVVAHDLHPDYRSTRYALDHADVKLVGVQHHHAHIASCLVDNDHTGPAIGVAFDGTGYGTDGTLWGGELLVADLAGYERVGHLAPVPLPGGSAAVRQPWRVAAAYLDIVYGDNHPDLALRRRHQRDWDSVVALSRRGVNAPRTSSAGRLFDAVSAILGLSATITYEGQAAIALEQAVDRAERGGYAVPHDHTEPLRSVGFDLIRCVVEDVRAGVDTGRIAARFHHGLATAIVAAVDDVSRRTGLDCVALSGGVFQNAVLLDTVVTGLEDKGLRPLVHSRVPPNDGGISLGQAAVAAHAAAPLEAAAPYGPAST